MQLLSKMGFDWGTAVDEGMDEWDRVRMALDTYRAVFRDLKVPARFAVPDEAPWPEPTRGLRLGMRVAAIRNSGKYKFPVFKEALRAVGFETETDMRNAATDTKFQKVVSALELYRTLNGNLEVPQGFVVPSAEPWPVEFWGMNLGLRVANIRNQGTFVKTSPRRRQVLDRLGFVWLAAEGTEKPKRGRR
ncbi:unnamed protein product, partial [Phaeothamnion confervicola]